MEDESVSLEELAGEAAIQEEADLVDGEEAPEGDESPPAILAELVIEEVSIDGMCGVY